MMELILAVLILFQGIGIGFNCVAFCCIASASFWYMLFCPKPNYFVFHSVAVSVLCTLSDAVNSG